ncbi:MAG: vitamin K epoxide reductase family protein [Candidatus Binatia bacterium]
MGKASKGKLKQRKKNVEKTPTRSVPNWPLLSLALIGTGITGYLTASTWTGQAVAGCTVGSGCDVVLNSRWATLFGLPTSLWGFLTYAGLAGIAFIKRSDIHWKLAWVVALFGVSYSVYLTTVSVTELEVTCPYCISSATLMFAILGTVIYQWPRNLPGFSWRSWLLRTVPVVLVIVVALHLHYAALSAAPVAQEDPQVRSLAEHLAKTKAKFYGAFWCPHCKQQKALFGASVGRLPYIECSPQGRRGPEARVCRLQGIRSYPTWIIKGRRYEGLLSLGQLAYYSGFEGEVP